MSTAIEPNPFLKVTVGSLIFTSDEQKIGTVKERRGGALKVGTRLLRRDYWLPAGTIKSATPDAPVILWIAKAELEQYKLTQPPAAA